MLYWRRLLADSVQSIAIFKQKTSLSISRFNISEVFFAFFLCSVCLGVTLVSLYAVPGGQWNSMILTSPWAEMRHAENVRQLLWCPGTVPPRGPSASPPSLNTAIYRGTFWISLIISTYSPGTLDISLGNPKTYFLTADHYSESLDSVLRNCLTCMIILDNENIFWHILSLTCKQEEWEKRRLLNWFCFFGSWWHHSVSVMLSWVIMWCSKCHINYVSALII